MKLIVQINTQGRSGNILNGSVFTNEQVVLVGVNVTNLATGFQVQTDEDGRFSIPYNSVEDEIRFSHVGFDYDTIKVKDFYSLMELWPATEWLDEVTVTGNGKGKSNLIWWLLGGAVVIAVGYNVVKSDSSAKDKAQFRKKAIKV